MNTEMPRARTTSVGRMAAEGFLIVVSILLAFALEAWWNARQDISAEQEILGRLKLEVASNTAQLSEKRERHQETKRAAEALLSLTGRTPSLEIAPDSVSRLIWRATWAWTYDPASGVLSSLIASGRLGIIRNDSLRSELAGWPALVSDVQEDEHVAWRTLDERIGPFLDRHIAWRSVASLAEADYPAGPSTFPNDVSALLSIREFENIIEGKRAAENGILLSYDSLSASLGRMARLIDQELRDRR